MTDQDQSQPNDANAATRHLEQSLSSGRITPAEADVIRSFFACEPTETWPASALQRRMQSSGG